MPVYSYRCESCGASFERTESLSEHAKTKPVCPHCGSEKTVWAPAPFVAVTGKKS